MSAYTLLNGETGTVDGTVSLNIVLSLDALFELKEMSMIKFEAVSKADGIAEVVAIRSE